jgi:DNA polymerase V
VDIPDGFLLVDSAAAVKPGSIIVYQCNGYSGPGKMYRYSLVTEEGEVMEGEPLNNVIVPGKMTRGVRHIDVSF